MSRNDLPSRNLLRVKWLLRHEGPRDHVDMIMNLAVVPNVVVVDMANMVVAHARNRGYNVFQPFDGRFAECTQENIQKARDGELEVDWPWFPNGTENDANNEVFFTDEEQTICNPSTGSAEHYCLFDQFHEKTLLIQPIVCGGSRALTNLQERQVPRRPSSLTT